MAEICEKYFDALSPSLAELYKEKINIIDGIDPYILKWKDLRSDYNNFPPITRSTLLEYLIFRVSEETSKEIKSYKSLEAFKQVACRWIEYLKFAKIKDLFVLVGKVAHSQRLSEAKLLPWVIITENAEILESHCTCLAGFGKTCTHVASLLIALEHATLQSAQTQKSVTDVLAYWIGPKQKSNSLYMKLEDIDFRTPQKILDDCDYEENKTLPDIPSLTDNEVKEFLKKCHDSGGTTVLYAMLEGPANEIENPLTKLYSDDSVVLSFQELQNVAKDINITLTPQECQRIEQATQAQANCSTWFLMRTGRITASMFKKVCTTNPDNPAMSTIKMICYPKRYNKSFRATEYGCKHEKEALHTYLNNHKQFHPSAKLKKCGFIINPNYPYFGASPDGILECEACGQVSVEVKCPFCARDSSIQEWSTWKNSWLISENGILQLKRDHQYYYQVQMQMAVFGSKLCDFVVWSPVDFFVERIQFNQSFWEEKSKKADTFMKKVILPELIGKYYTNLETET